MSGLSTLATLSLAVLSLSLAPSAVRAQPRGDRPEKSDKADIPKEYVPPAGMCRVWIEGVPAAQQPAPTDCATAVRTKPANGRVIYGADKSKTKKVDDLPVNQLRQGGADRKGPPLVPPDPSVADARRREAWDQKKVTDEQLFGDRPATGSPASSYPGTAGLPPGAPGSSSGNVGPGYVTPQGAIVPGTVNDPRYFAPNATPPGTGSSICLDRDGDGWCDDLRFGPPACTDRDRDGRCDDLPAYASQAFPQVLPAMRSALDVIQGRTSPEVMQWLGTNEFIVRVPEQGRGGIPWRAIFLDPAGALLQVWTDANRDGRADRIEIFRNGERVKLIQR